MLTLALLLWSMVSVAQKYTNNWIFNYNGGLHFSDTGASQFHFEESYGQLDNNRAAHIGSCISDSAGNLALYTKRDILYNSFHEAITTFDSVYLYTKNAINPELKDSILTR